MLINKKYKSYQLSKYKNIVELRSKISKLKKDEILVKVIYTGVCGSDISTYLGRHPYKKPPIVCGHEMLGRVVSFGKSVENLKPNDLISILPYNPCLKCQYCKNQNYNFCQNKTVPGFDRWNGTFAEYFLAKKNSIFKIKKKIELLDGVLLEPLAISNHAMEQIKNKNDIHSCLIFGSGNIGLTTLINFVKKYKLKLKKIFIGCIDIENHKKKITSELGASYFINNNEKNVKQKIFKNTNSYGVDLIFLCTSYPGCIDDAINYINEKGQIIILSYFDKKSMTFNINNLIKKEIILTGSYLSNFNNFSQSLKIISSNKKMASKIISHTLPLSKTKQAFKMMSSKKIKKNKIILFSEEKN